MTTLEAKHFFAYNRFPNNELTSVLRLVYLPIGVMLFVIRSILILFLISANVLPDYFKFKQNLLNNLACICFGINVSVENIKKMDISTVYIGNYLSVIDPLAISKAFGFVLPMNNTPLKNLPGLGIMNFGSVNNTENFRKNLEAVKPKYSIFLCPEDVPTNGKAILKFNTKYFDFIDKVQPICITVKRPLLNISVSTISSTYIHDIFYFMYSPCTIYTIKILPSLEKKSLSGEEFAKIVQDNIAKELKVEASPLTASDLLEWSKRHVLEKRRVNDRTRIRSGGSQTSNPELQRMASIVKTVFPNIPIGVIYGDLAVTRNIDTTITNILDGRVRYVPEIVRSTPTPSSSESLTTPPATKSPNTSTSTVPITQLSTAAQSFGKTANERTKSFKERKEQLIAAARRRYIEKHNLDIPL